MLSLKMVFVCVHVCVLTLCCEDCDHDPAPNSTNSFRLYQSNTWVVTPLLNIHDVCMITPFQDDPSFTEINFHAHLFPAASACLYA